MVDIVVATNGHLGQSILNTAEMILGNTKDILFIDLSLENFKENFVSNLSKYKNSILILVDYSSKESDTILDILKNKENVAVVTGINLFMMLEAIIMRDQMELGDLKNHIIKLARESIIDLKEKMSEQFD